MAKKRPLDERQLEQLLGTVSDMPRDYEVIVRLGAHAGLRASEMAHLKASWFDWHNDQIHVPEHDPCDAGMHGEPCADCRTKAERSEKHTVDDYWRPKTEAGERPVPIGEDPDTRRILRDYFKRHERLVNRQGTPMSRQTIWSRVRDLNDEVSFDREFGPHHLRHTYGTIVAYNTEDPFFIKRVMGHADISSSQTYVEYTGTQVNEKSSGMFG